MNARSEPFFRDEYDALRQMIAKSGRSEQDLALHLFPDLKRRLAHGRLLACLNPAHNFRLSLGQVIEAMRFCGRIDPLIHACDMTGHNHPVEGVSCPGPMDVLTQTIESAADSISNAVHALEMFQEDQGRRQCP